MRNPKAFLAAILVLTAASMAEADLILTVNGLDTAGILEIPCKGSLVIAVSGQSDVRLRDLAVISDTGRLEPLIVAGTPAKERVPGEYQLTFADEATVARVSLKAGAEVVYQLVIFYVPQTGSATIFGIDKEALTPRPESEIEPQDESASGPAKDSSAESLSNEPAAVLQIAQAGRSSAPPLERTLAINVFPDPNSYPDFNGDKIVNSIDFAVFAEHWQQSGSGLDGDIDNSGTVDANDLATFAYFWLNGPHPLDVFESFKTALAAGDVNEALTSVAEISRDKYAQIFATIETHLSDYAAGMGEMTFDRQRFGGVIYEMQHQDGPDTLSFPILFIRDEDGNWRLFNF
ncbi:MAG: hypothetical protein MIO92_16635 [Methanosarcinaceae archaeon]|nr:hypothetical protein [Methanosarcinaceae archaeon]